MHTKLIPSGTAFAMKLTGLCVGLFAGLFAGLAQAAPNDLDRVTITVRRGTETIHTNVRATCPGIDASLGESLGVTQVRHQREGMTTVAFRLSGSEITEIQQRGGPLEYRTDIRRAVRKLACHTEGQDQLYVMRLVFRNEAESDEPNAPARNVALLD